MPEGTTRSLRLRTPPGDVDAVHELLSQVWADSPTVGDVDRFSFETALVELASNVIQHADPGSGITCDLVIERRNGRLRATLVDTGVPGDVSLVGIAMPDETAESGRGMALIQALVDEVEHDRVDDRNLWRITRALRE